MPSLQEDISRDLRSILRELEIGADIAHSSELGSLLSGLEHLIPSLLREKYGYWKDESLDGLLVMGRKIGLEKAEFNGFCILITDQSVTPVHIRLRASSSENEIDWMTCGLGEPGTGKGRMKRIPCTSCSTKKLINLIFAMAPSRLTGFIDSNSDKKTRLRAH